MAFHRNQVVSSPLAELLDLINRLNQDPRFHGILVQAPLPRRFEAAGAQILELNFCCPNMSFNVDVSDKISKEQYLARDSARDFLAQHLSPSRLRQLLDTDTGFDPAVWRGLADLGWPAVLAQVRRADRPEAERLALAFPGVDAPARLPVRSRGGGQGAAGDRRGCRFL
jgi:uncharacterized protein YkuJ